MNGYTCTYRQMVNITRERNNTNRRGYCIQNSNCIIFHQMSPMLITGLRYYNSYSVVAVKSILQCMRALFILSGK